MPLQLSFDNLDEPAEDEDRNTGGDRRDVQGTVPEREHSIAERFSKSEAAQPAEKRAKKERTVPDASEATSADRGEVTSDEVPQCRRSCFNCMYGSKDSSIPDMSAVCSHGRGYVIPDADRKGGECGLWVLSDNDTYTYYIKEETGE